MSGKGPRSHLKVNDYKQALRASIRHDASSIKKIPPSLSAVRPSVMQNHQLMAITHNFNATQKTNQTNQSKAETGGFSPASSKMSSVSGMQPD